METILKDVNGKFKAIMKVKKKLNKLSVKPNSGYDDKVWELDKQLKELLREFLRMEFTLLSKERFLTLCDLVSSHRPVEPFSFLVSVSLRKKEIK
jgi:hypothetical protein